MIQIKTFAEEYSVNYDIQKQYAAQEIKPEKEQNVEFVAYDDRLTHLSHERFFFWDGKWRNTNPNSRFGAVVIDENNIRPVLFYLQS